MKVVCAWCRKILVEEEIPSGMISHGFCPDCLGRLVGGNEISLTDFLDTLEFPVLVTNRDMVILEANRPVTNILDRPADQLKNRPCGVAIQCWYSQLPGGCGQTEHCAGCTLRKTITDTYGDGRPRYGAYSQHHIMDRGGTRLVRFRFSTVKTGDAVMLSIEAVENLETAS
jgi:PAS domain-containing protein